MRGPHCHAVILSERSESKDPIKAPHSMLPKGILISL